MDLDLLLYTVGDCELDETEQNLGKSEQKSSAENRQPVISRKTCHTLGSIESFRRIVVTKERETGIRQEKSRRY